MTDNFQFTVREAVGRPGYEIVLSRSEDSATVLFYLAACRRPEALESHMSSLTEGQLSAFFPGNRQHKVTAKKQD